MLGSGSLLYKLAPYTKIPQEDIATLSLCSIIDESPTLRNVFTKLLCDHLYLPMDEDVGYYKTQVTGKQLERPDVVGFNNVGKEVLICEAKFFAALTENQPVTYLERLSEAKGKGLVFLCPEKRIYGLWKQLSETEGAETIEEYCVCVQGVRMGIVSWEELLETFERNGAEMQSDIQELKVYCLKMIDENTFIPFSESDLGADVAAGMERYYKVMDQLRELLLSKKEYGITQKGDGKGSLQSTPQMGGDYYIYMKAKNCCPHLFFDKYAWRQQDSVCTPFWLALENTSFQQDEGVKKYISSLPEEMSEKSKKGVSLIALETPAGLELEETVRELCNQVLKHIDGYVKCIGL